MGIQSDSFTYNVLLRDREGEVLLDKRNLEIKEVEKLLDRQHDNMLVGYCSDEYYYTITMTSNRKPR